MSDGEAMEPGALADRLRGPDPPLVVDVRDPEPFDAGHLPESENVPVERLPAGIEGADHVVLVCDHGKASETAARLVRAAMPECRVQHLAGGVEAWDGSLSTADERTTFASGGVHAGHE